jgi:RNA polymerase sigma-70 factor (ECF subfamily)
MSLQEPIFEAIRPRLEALALRLLGEEEAAAAVVAAIRAQWRLAPALSPDAARAVLVAALVGSSLTIARARREPDRPAIGQRRREPPSDRAADEVVATLFLLLEDLPPAQRLALVMRKAFAMDHRDIALQLGLTEADCVAIVERASVALANRSVRGSER